MDNERTRDQEIVARKSADDRADKPGGAADGFLLVVALLVSLAGGGLIAIGMPQVLEIAASHAYASSAAFADLEPADQEERASQPAEEEPEPMIVDDLRTEGVMYAFADLFCPIEC